ncbi:MAG: hypothetical protein HYW25_04715 [Candidatus Aenigmarchaeota archaeon]|nr:hypothetical protein [Candidatus Aenigmarchaeota archaeon]
MIKSRRLMAPLGLAAALLSGCAQRSTEAISEAEEPAQPAPQTATGEEKVGYKQTEHCEGNIPTNYAMCKFPEEGKEYGVLFGIDLSGNGSYYLEVKRKNENRQGEPSQFNAHYTMGTEGRYLGWHSFGAYNAKGKTICRDELEPYEPCTDGMKERLKPELLRGKELFEQEWNAPQD